MPESISKALAALCPENGVKVGKRKRVQGLLSEVRRKARALVQQLDAGAPVQGVL